MKQFLGILLVIAGLALGVCIGFYLCFIGGIVQIVSALTATEIAATAIAWGIAKVFFAGTIGIIVAIIFIIPGKILISSK